MNRDTKIAIGVAGGIITTAALVYVFRKQINNIFSGHKCSNSFLFIGDSNTAGSNSYADKFISRCKNPKNKKIAKSGATTDWMLPKLFTELNENQYDVVTILAGSNDIFARLSVDKAKKNMDKMLSAAKKSGAKIVVITPPYKGHYPRTTQTHLRLIQEWNNYLKNHKTPFKFIDFSQIVRDKSLFLSDNQHVNSQGHQILTQAYLKALKIS